MRRHVITVLAAALAVPGAAAAKGPIEGTVTGPGLDHALTLTGGGHPGSAGTLGRVAEHAGFFQAAFGSPSTLPSLASEPPNGELGPRYTIRYRMGPEDLIRQDVYPYAERAAASYMPPGQRFYETMKTPGGWYTSGPDLKAVLVEAGLPPTAPSDGSGTSWTLEGPWPVAAAVVLAVALGCALALAVFRRRAPAPLPR
jgi:hypothetical protein